jgi:hypothetical protein
MTPIDVEQTIVDMTDSELREKLNYISYTFCVNADFTKEQAIKDIVIHLEMLVMEGLLRVLEDNLGYSPLQNKIYEKTEIVFGDQDSYNINRMMSSLRRAKVNSIDATDDKYIKWLKNRVKYGVKGIRQRLTELAEIEG